MYATIEQFINENIDQGRTVLIGLSGGADSMCLFHLLLKYRTKKPLHIHICHVDHGWREESVLESKAMVALAKEHGIPITTAKFHPEAYKGNWEAEARADRIRFFTQVALETNAQGIFLAHHFDDQLETTFKRFLEGGMLLYLGGIRPITKIGALTLFRPLLKVPKCEILRWIHETGITYFEDPTNSNPEYLRGRLRTQVFPFLRESFGKEFSDSIGRISSDAQEMRTYFDAKLQPFIKNSVTGPFGIMYDLSETRPQHIVEYKEFFRCIGEISEFSLNRTQLETALYLMQQGVANKTLLVQEKKLYFDRRRLFVFFEEPYEKIEMTPVALSEGVCGSWKIRMRKGTGISKNSWLDVWKGSISVMVDPKEIYFFTGAKASFRHKRLKKSLQRLFNDAKVPHRLTTLCPIIITKEQEVVEDFCRGTVVPLQADEKEPLYIELEKISSR